MPVGEELLSSRIVGFGYIDKTKRGDVKVNIEFDQVGNEKKVRLFALLSKDGKMLRLYRPPGKYGDLFATVESRSTGKSAFNRPGNPFAQA